MDGDASKQRSSRSLSCELSPDGNLGFTEVTPYSPGGPGNPTTISGIRKPNGTITGQQAYVGGDGKPHVVRTGEPGLASDTLEYETLPRIAKTCNEALHVAKDEGVPMPPPPPPPISPPATPLTAFQNAVRGVENFIGDEVAKLKKNWQPPKP